VTSGLSWRVRITTTDNWSTRPPKVCNPEPTQGKKLCIVERSGVRKLETESFVLQNLITLLCLVERLAWSCQEVAQSSACTPTAKFPRIIAFRLVFMSSGNSLTGEHLMDRWLWWKTRPSVNTSTDDPYTTNRDYSTSTVWSSSSLPARCTFVALRFQILYVSLYIYVFCSNESILSPGGQSKYGTHFPIFSQKIL